MTSDTHSYSTTHIQSFSSHEIVDLLDPPAYLKVIKFTKFGDPGSFYSIYHAEIHPDGVTSAITTSLRSMGDSAVVIDRQLEPSRFRVT